MNVNCSSVKSIDPNPKMDLGFQQLDAVGIYETASSVFPELKAVATGIF